MANPNGAFITIRKWIMIAPAERKLSIQILSRQRFEEDRLSVSVEFALQNGKFLDPFVVHSGTTTVRFANAEGRRLLQALRAMDSPLQPHSEVLLLWKLEGELIRLRPQNGEQPWQTSHLHEANRQLQVA